MAENGVNQFSDVKIHWGSGVTFPPLQKSVIKIQTREWLEKTHKSVLLTNDT